MQIVYYFKDYKIPMYQWQHVHIIDELKAHNCFITIINPLEYETVDSANEALKEYLMNHKIDLFMTPHNEQDLKIDTLETIKKKGIPTLLICFDNLIVPFMHYTIAPHFDLVWLTSKETKPLFDKLGCRTVFLPYAANPFITRTEETVKGVGFVGTPYGSRINTINALINKGIPVYCHCISNNNERNDVLLPHSSMSNKKVTFEFIKFQQGRKVLMGAVINKLKKDAKLHESELLHLEEVVPPSELYQVYPKYSLTLSSTTARNTGVLRHPLFIVNLRSFEIPMSGGIQICRYNKELSEYFKDGEEIIFYKNDKEMVDKIRYYLSDEQTELRQKIRKSARKRAEENHTWYCRFQVIFKSLHIKYDEL